MADLAPVPAGTAVDELPCMTGEAAAIRINLERFRDHAGDQVALDARVTRPYTVFASSMLLYVIDVHILGVGNELGADLLSIGIAAFNANPNEAYVARNAAAVQAIGRWVLQRALEHLSTDGVSVFLPVTDTAAAAAIAAAAALDVFPPPSSTSVPSTHAGSSMAGSGMTHDSSDEESSRRGGRKKRARKGTTSLSAFLTSETGIAEVNCT